MCHFRWTEMDFLKENYMKRIVEIISISFPCSTLFFTAVNSFQLLWEYDDSCCLFSNSYLNCAMVLFPMGRPELIPV